MSDAASQDEAELDATPLGGGLTRLVHAAATAAVNHALRSEAWARTRLAQHAGKTVRIDLAPIEMTTVVMEDGLLGAAIDATAADVTLSLPMSALPMIIAGAIGDDAHAAAMRHVRIVGDAELAHVLSTLFQHLRWDVEEDLSRVVGDAAAHRLVAGAKAVAVQVDQVRVRAVDNVVEYLTEERPTLVARVQLDAHARAVRALTEDLDRLDKRIARLK